MRAFRLVVWMVFLGTAFAESPPVISAVKTHLQYRETIGKKSYFSTADIELLRARRHLHNEDRISSDDYLIDTATFECSRWLYMPKNGSVKLTVVRNGRLLSLDGVHSHGGKRLEKEIRLGKYPWCQEWMSFLGAFALSGRKTAIFCSLVTPTLDLAQFTATVLGEETVKANTTLLPAIHVRVKFSGALSVTWHGDYWFRTRDGRFVRFEGSILPGLPVSVFELMQ
jgi:hypothetical protein